MKLYFREFSESEKEMNFGPKDGWFRHAVLSVDETPIAPEGANQERPMSLRVVTHKTEDIYWICGEIRTEIQVHCSRCGEPIRLRFQPKFQHLVSQNPKIAESPIPTKGASRRSNPIRFDGDDHQDSDVVLVEEDYLDLSAVVAEHLNIEIPLQPTCQDATNVECENALSELLQPKSPVQNNPFSVLKDFSTSKKE